ncbi:MAG: hypothetical protein N6V41_01155, partial [Candidatus Portiera aleyrodidarum]|nr:hypothetical protein [Candidatus Portiera aleyrodidarum]
MGATTALVANQKASTDRQATTTTTTTTTTKKSNSLQLRHPPIRLELLPHFSQTLGSSFAH